MTHTLCLVCIFVCVGDDVNHHQEHRSRTNIRHCIAGKALAPCADEMEVRWVYKKTLLVRLLVFLFLHYTR
jgi:hypothetical protein